MAKGSHATWGDMPRECFGCGEKLTMKHGAVWLDTMHHQSWHMECKLKSMQSPTEGTR